MKVVNVNPAREGWRGSTAVQELNDLWLTVLLHGEGEHKRWEKEEKREEGMAVSAAEPPQVEREGGEKDRKKG